MVSNWILCGKLDDYKKSLLCKYKWTFAVLVPEMSRVLHIKTKRHLFMYQLLFFFQLIKTNIWFTFYLDIKVNVFL